MQHGDSGRRAWRENDLTTSLDAQSARGSGRRARPVLGSGWAGGRAGGRAGQSGLQRASAPAKAPRIATPLPRGEPAFAFRCPALGRCGQGGVPGFRASGQFSSHRRTGRSTASCAHPGGGARPAGHGAPVGRHRPVPAHARVPGGLDSSDFGFRFFKSLTGQ